ncbi:MAG: pyruvate kinase [Anaerostipes sp.]|nr:pyruvate kinase [Anaerostipes sp.]
MTRKEVGMNYFLEGYNCAQSVVLAFSDILSLDEETLMKISCSFGGGMGRLREVCGSVSGMFLVAGLLYGYDGPETGQVKSDHYARIQYLAHEFEEKNGSIVCRELLGLSVKHDVPKAAERTKEYYKKRPCKEIVGIAVEILDDYIKKNPYTNGREKNIKYYGTLGPACEDAKILMEMLQVGMTGIRLNLSHKSLVESREWVNHFLKAKKESKIDADFMIDLMGPELRMGNLDANITLKEGESICLGDKIMIPDEIEPFLKPGQVILFDDGKVKLQVEHKKMCKVLQGGILSSKKSIALPGCDIKNSTLTAEDLENLSHIKEFQVTQVMLPFVRGKEDLICLRQRLDQLGCEHIKIFAKIENVQGVENVEEFMPYCDCIVIARGDLGNAVPLTKLPLIQEQIANVCKRHGKEFMVVTQMLNSMIESPYPTRAEVNDIFHAVRQGASSIMLTGETAAGKYPVESMKILVETGKTSQISTK